MMVLIALPCLVFSQAKPTRDKFKDKPAATIRSRPNLKNIYSHSHTAEGPHWRNKRNSKTKVSGLKRRDVYSSYVGRRKNGTPYPHVHSNRLKEATYLLVDQHSSIQKAYGFLNGSETFYVSTNGSKYDVSALPNWCEVSKNRNSFVLTFSRNESHEKRSSWFVVKADNQSVVIHISQDGKPNISATVNNVDLFHNMHEWNGSGYTTYLSINTGLSIQGAKGQRCFVVAYVMDEKNHYINASSYYSSFALSSGVLCTVTEIVPTGDSPQTYNLTLKLPNNAMWLNRKKNKLRCELRVFCTTTIEYVSNVYYTPFFNARFKKGKVVTKP
jgi:hypothetical protein